MLVVVDKHGGVGTLLERTMAMPKARSATRRTKARQIAADHGVSHAEALRRLNQAGAVSDDDDVATGVVVNLHARPGGVGKTTTTAPAWMMAAARQQGASSLLLIEQDAAVPVGNASLGYSTVLIDLPPDRMLDASDAQFCVQTGYEWWPLTE